VTISLPPEHSGSWTTSTDAVLPARIEARRKSNAQRVQGFGSSGVPQFFGSLLADIP
jgi:hypothetical protein